MASIVECCLFLSFALLGGLVGCMSCYVSMFGCFIGCFFWASEEHLQKHPNPVEKPLDPAGKPLE